MIGQPEEKQCEQVDPGGGDPGGGDPGGGDPGNEMYSLSGHITVRSTIFNTVSNAVGASVEIRDGNGDIVVIAVAQDTTNPNYIVTNIPSATNYTVRVTYNSETLVFPNFIIDRDTSFSVEFQN